MMMNIDPLAKLLRDVDAEQPPPVPVRADDLVARVRRRAWRRRRVAQSMAAVGLLMAVGGAWSWHASWPSAPEKAIVLATSPTTATAPAPVDVAQLRRQLARLNSEAELHERTARLILAREQAAAVAPLIPPPDAGQALTAQVERSALTLVNRGDALLHDPNSNAKAEAAESFKRVLELFPRSGGAALARERLSQIGA